MLVLRCGAGNIIKPYVGIKSEEEIEGTTLFAHLATTTREKVLDGGKMERPNIATEAFVSCQI